MYAAAPPSISLVFNLRYPSQQNLVVMDASKNEYRIKRRPAERLRATDRAVRG